MPIVCVFSTYPHGPVNCEEYHHNRSGIKEIDQVHAVTHFSIIQQARGQENRYA